MTLSPLKERRKRAGRRFLYRVGFLVVLIGGIAYAAWFAPWARPLKAIPVHADR